MKKNIRDYAKVGVQYSYILDNIQNYDGTLTSDKEKVECFFDELYNVQYKDVPNAKRHGMQELIEDMIRGCCSSFNCDMWQDDIIALGKSWGYCNTERKAFEFYDRFFSVLAYRLIKLAEYFKIDLARFR